MANNNSNQLNLPRSILCVTNFGGTLGGGADRVLLNILNELPPSLHIYLVGGYQTEQLLAYTPKNRQNITVIDLSGYYAYAYMELEQQPGAPDGTALRRYLDEFFTANFQAVYELTSRLQGVEIDLVHSNTSVVALGALYASFHNLRHVWFAFESVIQQGQAQRFWLWFMRQFSDAIAVPAQATAAAYGPASRVIYSGYEVPTFLAQYDQLDPGALNQSLKLADDQTVIACLGIISERKGQLDLLRAVQQLRAGDMASKLKVILAGYCPDTAYSQAVQTFIAEHQLQELVTLTGLLSHAEVMTLLKRANLVVQPSLLPDPYPTTIVEAMLAGKPIIASQSGGIPEMIEAGQTGLLVQPGQPADLADKIAELLNRPALAAQLARQAASLARDKFDIRHTVASLTELYGQVLSQPLRVESPTSYWQSLLLAQAVQREGSLNLVRQQLTTRDVELGAIYSSHAWKIAQKMQQSYRWIKGRFSL